MNARFDLVLLGTSRVIWPPGPEARKRLRITIRTACRLGAGRAYVALLAFPLDRDQERRARFMGALEDVTAGMIDPDERPAELRHLPRREKLAAALRAGIKRMQRVMALADRLPFDPREAARALAEARTERRSSQAEPLRASDVLAREIAPLLPLAHLALPLVAGRQPEVVASFPELAPPSMPHTARAMILSDHWPLAALDAAERWRQAVVNHTPELGRELVEVRALLVPN